MWAWPWYILREIKSVRTRSVLGAIACPPSFLKVPSELHTVHLIHYVPPLRLIWLTFGLPYWLQDLVEALMTYYGNRDPEATDKLNSYLVTHYPDCPSVELPDAMRANAPASTGAFS